MPFDEQLADRIRVLFKGKRGIIEKRMFGGICFMVRGNMACGIDKNNLMIRVGPKDYEAALKEPHARIMDITGRPLKGFVFISPAGYKTPAGLKKWIDWSLAFAKSLPAK